jgi:hypothetical protein
MATKSWMRTGILMVGAAGLVVASWSCKNDGVACTGSGGGSAEANLPVQPKRACTGQGDIATECPLPESVYGAIDPSDPELETIYYYSDPACVDGYCRYCVTFGVFEDPNDTAAP